VALPTAKVWGALIGLGLLSTVLAYVLFFRILASAGAVRLALVTFLIPVSATLLGVAFLDQVPELRHLAGFALIAVGLFAVGRRSRVTASSAGNSRST
jgi:drug/metabolite transporter (DMT)-like permease